MVEVKPSREELIYVNGPQVKPGWSAKPGETIVVYTADNWTNDLDTTQKLPKDIHNPPCPQSGPIEIIGAEPGDTLKVEIVSIERVRDWAVCGYLTGLGCLVPNGTTRMITDPLPEKSYIYKYFESDGKWHAGYNREDGSWYEAGDLVFDWDPFLGIIGTATEFNAYRSDYPHECGGNMDIPEVKPGNVLYLPVCCPGANLALGDVHGRQGQGEICGIAVEMAAKVTLKVELIKNKRIAWPRIESKDELMCVGCARPMEDAARIALCELIDWMIELGWEKTDAYQAVSQANRLFVGSMVNPSYVMVATIAKDIAYRKLNKK